MYLSRSQIINRDSVVWIERKRGESGGVGAWASVGKEGWLGRWSDGEGLQGAGGEIEREGGGMGSDRRPDG